MRKTNRILWPILTASALILTCLALTPGESHASIQSVDTWQTALQTSADTLSSDYLAAGGQTVLLAPLSTERTVTFSLFSSRAQVDGTLHCTVQPENAVTVTAEESVSATAEGTAVTMILTPAAEMAGTEVTVSVNWTAEDGRQMSADFKTTLTEDAPEETADQSQIEASLAVMEEFIPGTAMVVTIRHPADCSQILLGLGDSGALPAGTVYSADHGATGIKLYDAMQLQLQPANGKETLLLLQLPEEMESGSPVNIWANVICESGAAALSAQTTPLDKTLQLPENTLRVLTADSSMHLDLPDRWSNCTMSYTLQRLTEDNGTIGYTTVSASGDGFAVSANEDGITVSLAGDQVQAGTYRLTLIWRYEAYAIAQKDVAFYINYWDCSGTGTTGGMNND